MLIFLDTEFSSTHVVPRLISIGLISANGRTFYAELTDTWRPADCSEFVVETVLPLLEGGTARMTMAELTLRLGRWLDDFGDQAQLATDSTRWDWPLIEKIFEMPETWPANLERKPMLLQSDGERGGRFAEAVEAAFVGGLRRHHALDDAIANRLGWLAVSKHRVGVAKGVFEVPDSIDEHNGEVAKLWGK